MKGASEDAARNAQEPNPDGIEGIPGRAAHPTGPRSRASPGRAGRWRERASPRTGSVRIPLAAGLLAILVTVLLPSAGAIPPSEGPATDDGPVYLNVSATGQLAFAPDQLNVPSGSTVHLAVTQLADFNHTFTLSSVANFTIPTTDTPAQLYAFFQAHPPIVNLSLGDVVGHVTVATFTAPPPGTYEFVCTIPTHFQGGMHGVLVSGSAATGSSSSPIPTVDFAVIVVVVVAVAAVVLLVRRRSHAPPPSATPPKTEEKNG
ncbi:MAG TPA: plastocyanin/azurin family copper-binding protein [Thermoplasmata archaeon]|nr:plastocyanin/azurin family copper-binding protein [Thermoplasmata archaeon]